MSHHKHTARFIVLEGLDGTGKSTQVELLKLYLEMHNIPNTFIHFPRTDEHSPVYGQMIARFLRGDYGPLNQVHPELVALLYAGDRFNASLQIKKNLDEGISIIADRYVLSNIAYQCAKLTDIEERRELAQFIFNMEYTYFGIPKPDLSLFLHVPFHFIQQQLNRERQGSDRDYLRGKDDIHEQDIQFQKQVENVYMDVCNTMPSQLSYLNCMNESKNMMSVEEIHNKMIHLLKKKQLYNIFHTE
jgi:dTMP kinase